MPITRIPNPAKTAKQCGMDMLKDGYLTGSIIKTKHMKGWWPVQYNPDDDDDPNPILAVSCFFLDVEKFKTRLTEQ